MTKKYDLHIPYEEFKVLNKFNKLEFKDDPQRCFTTDKYSEIYNSYRRIYLFLLIKKANPVITIVTPGLFYDEVYDLYYTYPNHPNYNNVIAEYKPLTM